MYSAGFFKVSGPGKRRLIALALLGCLLLPLALGACSSGKDKDADSAAKEIQSRAGIYLAEQYG